MLLRENLEETGQRLFRWHSYLPLGLVGVLPVALCRSEHPFGCSKEDVVWELLCFGISAFGFGLRVKTVGHAPKGTSGRNMRNLRADEFGLLTFIVVRFLRKCTTLFDVPNR